MQNEREIDLLDLIYYVLTKWKMLILAGVIGLVLVGGYKFYSAEQARKATPQVEEAVKTATAETITKEKEILQLREEKAGLELQKDNLSLVSKNQELAREKAGELQNYLSESVLMRINAGAAPKAERTYVVSLRTLLSVDAAYYRDPADVLLAAYASPIILNEETTKKYSVPAKYLNELISVTADETANTVTVSAYGDSIEMAKTLLADACAVFEERTTEITDNYQSHDLDTVLETSGENIDTELAALQSVRFNELDAYLAKAKTGTALSTDDLEKKIGVLEFQIAEKEKELEKAFTAAEGAVLSSGSSIKKGIKYGIIGAIVFAILLAGIYFLIYVFDGKLHTVDELGHCYEMPLLVGLSASFGKGCALDKCFYRLRNKNAGTSNEVALQTASVTIEKLLEDCKSVAVLSSLDEQSLELVTAGLSKFLPGIQFIPVADSNQSVEAAEKLKAADAVIVFEKREASRFREIGAELHQARLLEKNIIGYIAS